jgi:hypothetical protein
VHLEILTVERMKNQRDRGDAGILHGGEASFGILCWRAGFLDAEDAGFAFELDGVIEGRGNVEPRDAVAVERFESGGFERVEAAEIV